MDMASLMWRFLYGTAMNGNEVMILVCRNTLSLEIYVSSQAFGFVSMRLLLLTWNRKSLSRYICM
jgi:hypothetical protein